MGGLTGGWLMQGGMGTSGVEQAPYVEHQRRTLSSAYLLGSL